MTLKRLQDFKAFSCAILDLFNKIDRRTHKRTVRQTRQTDVGQVMDNMHTTFSAANRIIVWNLRRIIGPKLCLITWLIQYNPVPGIFCVALFIEYLSTISRK